MFNVHVPHIFNFNYQYIFQPSTSDVNQLKLTPKSSKGASPVPKRSRLSLKGAKEGKDLHKLAPLFNQPKEGSTAPELVFFRG